MNHQDLQEAYYRRLWEESEKRAEALAEKVVEQEKKIQEVKSRKIVCPNCIGFESMGV